MRDRPDARTLLALAVPGPEGNDVTIATARAIAAREEAAGAAPVIAWADRLAALYGGPVSADPHASGTALERRLARDLRGGRFDRGPDRAAVRAHLIATVHAKLAEDAPAAVTTWPLLAASEP